MRNCTGSSHTPSFRFITSVRMGQSASSPSRPPDGETTNVASSTRRSRTRNVLDTVKRRSSQFLGRTRSTSKRSGDKHEALPPSHPSPSLSTISEPQPEPEHVSDLPPLPLPSAVSESDQEEIPPASPATEPGPSEAYSPGTLVVVQGVVHTSNDTSSQDDENDEPEEPSSTSPDSRPASPQVADPEPPLQSDPSPAQTDQRPLSPASIDVLGTLLSVAAAATAASLLSGSSSPAPTNTTATNTHAIDRPRPSWTSLRDRLGLRNAASSTPTSPPETPPADARSVMLAEMARAFGLGANNDNTPSSSDTDPPPPPPEGSFERFLVDLQADLRTALTTHSLSEPDSSLSHSTEESTAANLSPEDADCPPVTELDAHPPSLASLSDSDVSTSASSSSSSPPSSFSSEEPVSSATDSSEDPTLPERNRVNWWRMYRFPPVPAPPSLATTAPTSNGAPIPVSGLPFAGIPPSGLHSMPTTQPSDLDTDDIPPLSDTSTSPPSPPSNIVVPVIVVGLQSVLASNGRPSVATPFASPSLAPSLNNETAPGPSSETYPLEPPSPLLPNNSNERRSSWPSRAASALRSSLGARPQTPAPVAPTPIPSQVRPEGIQDEDGNRTFLIYVIGGYYPPTHSLILNGLGPSSLDSFEALLEIAELLASGSASKDTATKEEIERSELRVVKASALRSFGADNGEEKEVMENCIERCLICLDEYEDDADVRILGCRHAFHRDCVDYWLEKGRNNCPACRAEVSSLVNSLLI
ncbi:hypothetical protein DL96DRAFT_1583545, partial [Flagelloscypha sp. PMI_526]